MRRKYFNWLALIASKAYTWLSHRSVANNASYANLCWTRRVKCHLGRGLRVFWISIRLSNDRAFRLARHRFRQTDEPNTFYIRKKKRKLKKNLLIRDASASSQHLPARGYRDISISSRYIRGKNDALRIWRFWFITQYNLYVEQDVTALCNHLCTKETLGIFSWIIHLR